MDYTLLDIHHLDTQQHKLLASLHQSVMESLLSDLGMPIIVRFYKVAADDENVIGFCAVKGKVILGWVIGSPYPQVLNNKIRTPLIWFVLQMLRILLTRPSLLWQVAVSSRLAKAEFVPESDEIELTYIGVAPEVRGQKIGFNLLGEFINTSRKTGYQKVSLSVETDNASAISLYQERGFHITRTFSEGNFRRHRMELAL